LFRRDVKDLKQEIRNLKEQIELCQEQEMWQPNTPLETVPLGTNEKDNLIHEPLVHPVRETGVHHADMGLIDFDRGRKLHGTRGYILNAQIARLGRKLADFALDYYADQGFEEVGLPLLVNEDIAYATGHLPKFADEMFKTQDNQFLIPTAEMPLTGMHKDENLREPKQYVAFTPCFRREKIAYGKDNKGIKRVHCFNKIELYIICTPDQAEQKHLWLLDTILGLIKVLKLPHRIVELCTGDLGFAAAKTYDIEVYTPGNQEWMEVASVTNCTDFQARRANIKLNGKYANTLNGTGLAIERILIALLENNQDIDDIFELIKR
jgi:seryl-tRNA synthetase